MNYLKPENYLRFMRVFFICLLAGVFTVGSGIQAASGKSPSKREIAAVLVNLSDDNFEVRKDALTKISELGAPAVPALMEQLVGGERRSSTAAAIALGAIRDRRAVEPLMRVLNSDSHNVRIAATWALGEIGDPRAISRLKLLALADSYPYVSYAAVLAIWEIDSKEVIIPLLSMTYRHKDEYFNKNFSSRVMKLVPELLEAYPEKVDIWALIYFVRHHTQNPKPITPYDRINVGHNTPSVEKLLATEKAVVAALKILRDREIKTYRNNQDLNSMIWELMEKLAWDKAQWAKVRIAALSFEAWSDLSGRTELVSIVLDNQVPKEIRKKAITAITEAKKPVGLIEVFDKLDDDELRARVANSLADFPRDWIVDRLIGLLNPETCSNRYLCSTIVQTLGTIGDPRAFPVLLDIIENYKPPASRSQNENDWKSALILQSLSALGGVGGVCAVPALVETLKLDDPSIHAYGKNAFSSINLRPIIASLKEGTANTNTVSATEFSENCSKNGKEIILDFYQVAMDDNSPGLITARTVLAEAGAFQFLPPPPVPVRAREYYAMALGEVESENYRNAIDNFRAAVKIAPWWPAARYNLAVIEEFYGYPVSAVHHHKIYLVLTPDGENHAEINARMEDLIRSFPSYNPSKLNQESAKSMIDEGLPSRGEEEQMVVPPLQFVSRDRKKR